MRATTNRTADTTEWLTSLFEKLQPWTLATAVSGVAFGGAPAFDTLDLPNGNAPVPHAGTWEGSALSPASAENLSFSREEQIATYRRAQQEAKLALAVLRALRRDVGLPEVQEYFDAIDKVLEATSDTTSLIQTRAFTLGLQGARLQLLNEASSLRLWLRVAHILDPNVEDHRVPHRFVRWEPGEAGEEPFRLNRSDLRVRRTAARFFGDDGDSPASRS